MVSTTVTTLKQTSAGLVLVFLFGICIQLIWDKLNSWDNVAWRLKEAIKDKTAESDQDLIVEASKSTYFVLVLTIGMYGIMIVGLCVAAVMLGSDTVSNYLGSTPPSKIQERQKEIAVK